MNILLADASINGPDILDLVKGELLGCNIVTCFSGRTATEIVLVRNFLPDISIIDADLPDIPYLGLVELLKQQAGLTYTILILSRENGLDLGQAFAIGVDDWVLKPVDQFDLSMRLKKALHRKGWRTASSVVTRQDPPGEAAINPEQIEETRPEEALLPPPRRNSRLDKPLGAEPAANDETPIFWAEPAAEKEAPVFPSQPLQSGPAQLQPADAPEPGRTTGLFTDALEEGKRKRSSGDWEKIIRRRRAAGAAGNLFLAAFLLLMAALSLFLALSRAGGGAIALPGGVRLYAASAASGEPAVRPGDLIVFRGAVINEITPGEVVATGSVKDDNLYFHRVTGASPERGVIFTSVNLGGVSGAAATVDAAEITGKVVFSLPYFGRLLAFARTAAGLLVLILIPGTMVIANEIRILYRRVLYGEGIF